MNVTTEDIKKLRESTGVGMMNAKKALEEASSYEEAVALLRKKGHVTLAKKSERVANQGLVVSYIHGAGRVGVLLELNCETDFVARNDEFKALAGELAMHIAAAAPSYISREEVPQSVIDSEKEIYAEQMKDKPENMKEQILNGKLEKFFEQSCLVDQPYVRTPEIKVKDLIAEKVGKIGENIRVKRFARFVLGAE
jgi:elongation factor Ts